MEELFESVQENFALESCMPDARSVCLLLWCLWRSRGAVAVVAGPLLPSGCGAGVAGTSSTLGPGLSCWGLRD